MNQIEKPLPRRVKLVMTLAFGVALLAGAAARDAHGVDYAYTVTGTIHTPVGTSPTANDVAVRYIKVVVMDEEPGVDQQLGTGYTTATGTFSISVHDNELADIYINVEYVGNAIDGRFVEVRTAATDADPIKDVNIEATVHTDTPAGTLALGILHCSSTRANIVSHVCSAFRYLESQYSGYNLPENPHCIGLSVSTGSFVDNDGSNINISMDDYDSPGAGNSAFSDIHHETFHWIAYRAYGNRWPDTNCSCNPHFENKECCQGFAMQEGSAQYFGNISAIAMFGGDQKTNLPGPNTWRGEDNTGVGNSGEIVEGTYTLVLRQNGEHPGQLETLLTKSPDTWAEFRDGYATVRGSTSAEMRNLLTQMAASGINYTRGKLTAFLPDDDPPDAAPPADGNYKIIRDIAFIRGKVKPQIEQVTAGELHLESGVTVDADRKDIGYKPAAAGLNEGIPTGVTYVGAVNFTSDLVWDTKPVADEEYDVVVRTRNIHQWFDTFYPDFTGDATAAIDTNEKWLKTLQTWFNQDNTPSTDDEGKVVIDNTAPQVENFKPEPESP